MPTYIDKDKLMKEFIEFVAPSNRDSSLPIPTWNDAVSLLGSALLPMPMLKRLCIVKIASIGTTSVKAILILFMVIAYIGR